MASTTPKARALGSELRQARERAGISKRQLSIKLEFNHSTIGRWEAGKTTPRPEDVIAFLTAVDAPAQLREELSELARGGKAPRWLSAQSSDLNRQIAALIDFESRARTITDVAPSVVPGLLQTSDYARAIMTAAGSVPENEIEARVAVRVGRREIITRAQPATLHTLISEAALWQVVGNHHIQIEQLKHVLELSNWQHVTVQVLPLFGGWHPGLDGPFVMIESPDHPPVVHLDHYRSGLFFHEAEDTDAYLDAVENMKETAMTPAESAELIAQVIEEMEKHHDGRARPNRVA